MTKQRHSVVTGGNGFIGRALVAALKERGDRVTVIEPGGAPFRDDIDYVVVDVRDREAVRQAIEGADSVFHNASVVHTRRNREQDVWDVNLGGSRNVLDACLAAGVPRLIYVSSASAVYEGRDIENGTETLPYSRISQAPYADSKIAAEREILEANGRGGLATCAIRPHVVFGPGDTRFLPAILTRAKNGKLRFSVGLRNNKLSDFTYVTNVVDALLAADERLAPNSPVAGQPYFITNGEPMPFFDFVNWVLRELDMPQIRYAVPYPIAYAAAAVAEGLDTLRGGTLNSEDGLSRFAVKYMCTHHYFSIDKARRELGYEPRVNLREGIQRSVEHIRAQGLV
jgi:2-alkyl-3-oxoalkanoate reductase